MYFYLYLVNDTNYWIGGRGSALHPDQFSWTTGEQFSDTATFKPLWGHADIQAHLSMVLDHKNNFRWSYRHVQEKHGYVCEITKASLQKHQTTLAMTSSTSASPVFTTKVMPATWIASSASQPRLESTTFSMKSSPTTSRCIKFDSFTGHAMLQINSRHILLIRVHYITGLSPGLLDCVIDYFGYVVD